MGPQPVGHLASVHEAMYVSRQYLARIFASHGTTPGAELRRHRARLAHRLLADGFMDAAEIAAAAGFPSVRTMRRVLRND
ncbi:helix-turn-helix domain-containing protein [Microbacterium sp. LMI1-1-1.1]|uniref:helix-turn-helix domain-containing protein n=1 Tax=Microbacterium sp. LMI1-1-1.1 TaxID=3135223 RepID=UPI0034666A20